MKKRLTGRGLFCVVLTAGLLLLGGGVLCLLSENGEDGVYALATEGVLPETIMVKGLFLYEEQVVTAPASGTLELGFRTGDMVAAGEVCGELKRLNDIAVSSADVLTAPSAGIFSTRIDGWEHMFTVENLSCLDLPGVMESYEEPSLSPVSFVFQGDDCFKIIDAQKDVYFLASVENRDIGENSVTLYFEDEAHSAAVERIYGFGEERFYLFRMKPGDICFYRRSREATLLLGQTEGVLISASAVTRRSGETGVYCRRKDHLEFCPVTVVSESGGECIVTGLNAGECVLCDKKG